GVDILRGDQALVGVGGRHLDVNDRDVGACQPDFAVQFPGCACLADDLEARLGQQPVEPVPEQHLVVGDHDSHRISALIVARPPVTLPSSAPPRSRTPTISAGALPPSTSTTRRLSHRAADTLSVLAAACRTASDTTKYAAASAEEPSRSSGSAVISSGAGPVSASASTAADSPSSAKITGKIPWASSRRSARAPRNSASA